MGLNIEDFGYVAGSGLWYREVLTGVRRDVRVVVLSKSVVVVDEPMEPRKAQRPYLVIDEIEAIPVHLYERTGRAEALDGVRQGLSRDFAVAYLNGKLAREEEQNLQRAIDVAEMKGHRAGVKTGLRDLGRLYGRALAVEEAVAIALDWCVQQIRHSGCSACSAQMRNATSVRGRLRRRGRGHEVDYLAHGHVPLVEHYPHLLDQVADNAAFLADLEAFAAA